MKGKLNHHAQIQTIEALIATFILLAVLAVVVQATSVTPLTTSFTNQHIKYELQNMAQDILTSLDEIPYIDTTMATKTAPSRLEMSVSDWLKGSNTAYQSLEAIPVPPKPGDWYTFTGETTAGGHSKLVSATNNKRYISSTYLDDALAFAFSESGIAYNVEVRYSDNTYGNVKSAKMIWNGDPSDNCVTVSRYIALHDGDLAVSYESDLANGVTYLIPDISPDTTLHNVVEVRLTVWVM